MGTLIRRRGDHQEKALFGSRELRNVVVGMGSSNMLLHGAIPFLTQASFAAIGAIIILQWTDNLIIGVSDREGAGQGRSGWHCLHETVMAAGLEGDASQPTNKQAVQCQSLNQATQKIFKLKEPNVAIHAPIKAENFYRLILGENTHATD